MLVREVNSFPTILFEVGMEGSIILVVAHDLRFDFPWQVVLHGYCGVVMYKRTALDLPFDVVANRLLLHGRVVFPQRLALQSVEMRNSTST